MAQVQYKYRNRIAPITGNEISNILRDGALRSIDHNGAAIVAMYANDNILNLGE